MVEERRLRLRNGDAEVLNNYFCRMQSRNSNFFYVIDVDEDSHIRNIFWADARSRAACDSFSNVITFDTTYLTNSYDMSFAPFVGVNHHGESILLRCGLISKEDSETFIWLLKSWLTCMRGRAPRAIITDQCKAMEIAILEEVGQLGSKNDERCFVLTGILKEAKKKKKIMDIYIDDSLDGNQDSNKIHEESRNESKQFHSPLKVRSRGRPPTKRKQPKIEQIVKKAKTKSQKKGSTVDRKQDELSNLNSLSMIDDQSSQNNTSQLGDKEDCNVGLLRSSKIYVGTCTGFFF
ncbi:protein FAR1-RELATED SEQUENCE 6-like isoform X2 [Zingiber officinale]|uniref:protein FAR1-RELATED SEQUENCE 6-like isoform X2 n=1 Tax=Zingiber officinale TaxID=94328 RepID=UPI001C4B6B3F|nr:protein FAR1-RELATED SEQUENCE 6-like isoform X2 [Zingiber officinale]